MRTTAKTVLLISILLLLILTIGFFLGVYSETRKALEQKILADSHTLVWIATFQNEYAKRGLESMLMAMDSIQDNFVIALWNESQGFSDKALEQVRWQFGAVNVAHKNYKRTNPVSPEAIEKRKQVTHILNNIGERLDADNESN
ncbi:MAG: hypothetical protein PHE10_06130 [Kiritimatiellae bacterium]|nr:hypothetical protein [Kiritimatiellia bacterium]